MSLSKIIPVAIGVLTNPYVIAATVAVILYCNFVSYVARYKKKPPKPKKKVQAPEPAPAKTQEGGDGEASEDAAAEEE